MKKHKSNWQDKIFDIVNYTILTILLLITLFPFLYIFIYSIADFSVLRSGEKNIFAVLTLRNYTSVFRLPGLYNAAIISVSRAVIGTIITIICSSFFAYLVTKEKLPFRKLIYRFAIASMYFTAGFIPWYLNMRMLGLKNNYLLYILPSAVTAFYVVLIKTYIEHLPSSLEESAKIDGAGYIRIFAKIIFPLSMPVIASIAVFSAVGQWNTWIDNFFLVQNPKLQTLQLLLYNYLSQANNLATKSTLELTESFNAKRISPVDIKITMTMVVTAPIILVYPFMQKYFVKGIMLGAIKG